MDEQPLTGGRTAGEVRVAGTVRIPVQPGFVDRDTAGPSSRALDLAFAALSWIPLLPVHVASTQGFAASADRSARLHVLLDSYGYHTDRIEFGALIASRARMNADGICRIAGDDTIYVSLLAMAATYERAANDVEKFAPPVLVPPYPASERSQPGSLDGW